MPFTSRATWQGTQLECPHLRRTYSHLSQGIRPSKKATKISDVKRYLKDVVIASDGLLVVRDHQLFQPPRERLVVPYSVLDALHIRFSHPSKYQTKPWMTSGKGVHDLINTLIKKKFSKKGFLTIARISSWHFRHLL